VAIWAIWKLDALKSADGFAELLALLRILAANSHAPRATPIHLGADADAAFVESLDCDLVAFAGLADNIIFGMRQSSRISSQVEEARMPSCLLFCRRVNPGKSFSIKNAVMPLYPGRGIEGGEETKRPDSVALVIQSLPAVDDEIGTFESARVCRARHRSRETGALRAVSADGFGGHLGR